VIENSLRNRTQFGTYNPELKQHLPLLPRDQDVHQLIYQLAVDVPFLKIELIILNLLSRQSLPVRFYGIDVCLANPRKQLPFLLVIIAIKRRQRYIPLYDGALIHALIHEIEILFQHLLNVALVLRYARVVHAIKHLDVRIRIHSELHLFDVFGLFHADVLDFLAQPNPQRVILHKFVLQLIQFFPLGAQRTLPKREVVDVDLVLIDFLAGDGRFIVFIVLGLLAVRGLLIRISF